MYTWDEAKRAANLSKHQLDFADAYLVYENPAKITFASPRHDEYRDQALALVQVKAVVLSLAYQMRGEDVLHVISFRPASRKERASMNNNNNETKSQTNWEHVKRMADSDEPIPYDPEDGPYDPNDEAATEAYLNAAIIRRPGQRGPQKAPKKTMTTIRLSPEVLAYYKARSPRGWQTLLNKQLARYVARQQAKAAFEK